MDDFGNYNFSSEFQFDIDFGFGGEFDFGFGGDINFLSKQEIGNFDGAFVGDNLFDYDGILIGWSIEDFVQLWCRCHCGKRQPNWHFKIESVQKLCWYPVGESDRLNSV